MSDVRFRPAFPLRDDHPRLEHDWPSNGMTLRDYFAAHAPEFPSWYLEYWDNKKKSSDDSYIEKDEMQLFTGWRYEYADAMLEARKQ